MTNFADVVYRIIDLLDSLVVVVIGLALVWFLWGLVTYVFHSDSEVKRKEGIQYMVWGIIGLFVMVSLWSLVYIVANFIGSDVGVPLVY